jgi:hypothetical protein
LRRRDDAQALLAPALEGFSSTPEMPEAEALLSRLPEPGGRASRRALEPN